MKAATKYAICQAAKNIGLSVAILAYMALITLHVAAIWLLFKSISEFF